MLYNVKSIMSNEKLEAVIKYQLQAIRCFPTTLNLKLKILSIKH